MLVSHTFKICVGFCRIPIVFQLSSWKHLTFVKFLILNFGLFPFFSSSFLPVLQEMTIAAACAPPGGGRNPVTPRFIRHFSMLCLPTPSEHSLKQIFKVMRHTYTDTHIKTQRIPPPQWGCSKWLHLMLNNFTHHKWFRNIIIWPERIMFMDFSLWYLTLALVLSPFLISPFHPTPHC